MNQTTTRHRYVFLGPPGSGKGTQSLILSKMLNVPHISTGELFRNAVARKTPLGKKIAPKIVSGQLISDQETNALIKESLKNEALSSGYILDGYPRNLNQVEYLEKLAAPVKVILLELSEDIIIERISGRLICENCEATYHRSNFPPKVAGQCDKCGGVLKVREDDKEESVRERLRIYHQTTEPLVYFYESRKRLMRVDGSASVDEVNSAIKKLLVL